MVMMVVMTTYTQKNQVSKLQVIKPVVGLLLVSGLPKPSLMLVLASLVGLVEYTGVYIPLRAISSKMDLESQLTISLGVA